MLSDIQRRRSRRALASRPPSLVHPQLGQIAPAVAATVGDIKAQPVRMADVLVFGPLMIYSGLGKKTPNWLRVGMVVIGAGTILYNLANYFEVERRKRESGIVPDAGTVENELLPGLGQMNVGPFHKADPRLHRATVLTSPLVY